MLKEIQLHDGQTFHRDPLPIKSKKIYQPPQLFKLSTTEIEGGVANLDEADGLGWAHDS